MPTSLLGEWNVARPGEPTKQMAILGDRVVHAGASEAEKDEVWPAWALVSAGPAIEVVLVAGDGEGRIHYFQALPDGSFLTWRAESSEYRVLYRTDAPPSWLGAPKPR